MKSGFAEGESTYGGKVEDIATFMNHCRVQNGRESICLPICVFIYLLQKANKKDEANFPNGLQVKYE